VTGAPDGCVTPLVVRAITELIRNVNQVGKIRLENVVRVGFDAMEKVIVGSVEQVSDDRHIIATVTKLFAAAQQRSAAEHMPDHAGVAY